MADSNMALLLKFSTVPRSKESASIFEISGYGIEKASPFLQAFER